MTCIYSKYSIKTYPYDHQNITSNRVRRQSNHMLLSAKWLYTSRRELVFSMDIQRNVNISYVVQSSTVSVNAVPFFVYHKETSIRHGDVRQSITLYSANIGACHEIGHPSVQQLFFTRVRIIF